jgi:hypothetical protein
MFASRAVTSSPLSPPCAGPAVDEAQEARYFFGSASSLYWIWVSVVKTRNGVYV